MTYIILIVTVLISLYGFNRRDMLYKSLFNAYSIKYDKEWYRFITHGFIHGSWAHLIFNMITFYCFGRIVEAGFEQIFGGLFSGKIVFVLFYLSALFFSSLPDYLKKREDPNYNALGASGAVSAILFASILFHPTMGIYLFFIPIPIPAYIFAPLYLIYCHVMSKKNIDNIGHSAHFWGAVYGILFPIIFHPWLVGYFLDTLTSP